jgi:hypothetical protein
MEPEFLKFELRGSSACRRKQFRAIQRKYPDKRIVRSAPISLSDLYGETEEANTPQTHVVVILSEKSMYDQPPEAKEPDHYETQVVKDKSRYRPQV